MDRFYSLDWGTLWLLMAMLAAWIASIVFLIRRNHELACGFLGVTWMLAELRARHCMIYGLFCLCDPGPGGIYFVHRASQCLLVPLMEVLGLTVAFLGTHAIYNARKRLALAMPVNTLGVVAGMFALVVAYRLILLIITG